MKELTTENVKIYILNIFAERGLEKPQLRKSKDTGIWECIYIHHLLVDGYVTTSNHNGFFSSLTRFIDKLDSQIKHRKLHDLSLNNEG